MKVDLIKHPGGVFSPASEMEAERVQKLKNGEQYQFEFKLTRNPEFHRKVMAFFRFCFNYWKGENEFQCEQKQFDVFRSNLTCLAGFYEEYYNIKGEVRVEAKSISYGEMSQEEFEKLYNSLINAAIKHIFKDADENTYNQLLGFF